MRYLIVFIAISTVLAGDEPTTENPSQSAAPPPADGLNPEIVTYINKKIDKLLNKNSEKSSAEFKLANVFNNERKKLADSKLDAAATEADEAKAEQAMENFEKFLSKFENIEDKLNTAMENLELILDDDNTPVEQKYEALKLLNDLRESESIREAERNLKKYDKYNMKKNQNAAPTVPFPTAKPSEPSPTFTAPPLPNEYKVYFDQIIKILKDQAVLEDPKMQNYLQKLLKNPKQLKKLAKALKGFLDDEDEYDDYYDDIYDIFRNFV